MFAAAQSVVPRWWEHRPLEFVGRGLVHLGHTDCAQPTDDELQNLRDCSNVSHPRAKSTFVPSLQCVHLRATGPPSYTSSWRSDDLPPSPRRPCGSDSRNAPDHAQDFLLSYHFARATRPLAFMFSVHCPQPSCPLTDRRTDQPTQRRVARSPERPLVFIMRSV